MYSSWSKNEFCFRTFVVCAFWRESIPGSPETGKELRKATSARFKPCTTRKISDFCFMNRSSGSSETSKFFWGSWRKLRRRRTGRRWTDWNKTSPSTAWTTSSGKDIQLLSVSLAFLQSLVLIHYIDLYISLDAIRDLEDCLCLCFLYSTFPKTFKTPVEMTSLCRRLVTEFMHYVIEAKALRKVFCSIKGYYFQAEIKVSETDTWQGGQAGLNICTS